MAGTYVEQTAEATMHCTGSGSHNWFFCNFICKIEPNSTQTKYLITVTGEWWNTGRLNWSGDCEFIAKFYSSDSTAEQTKSVALKTEVHGTGAHYTFGPLVFETGSAVDKSITLNLDLDLTPTTGDNGRPGIYHRSDGGNIQHFKKNNWYFDLSAISLGNKPATPTLSNNNKYNENSGISASTNSLTIGISSTDWGEPDAGKIMWSCSNGARGELAKTSQFNVTGLSPGTSYTVTVYLENTIGSSDSVQITIRTRHNPPVVGLTITSVDLEKINLSWTSDKDLADTQYKIDNGPWQKLNQTGRSGTFVAKWFEPKTTHTIYFWGRATSAYDDIESTTISKQGTTLDKGHITSIGNCIFGLEIQINITSESNKPLQLEIWVEGDELSPRFTFNVSKGMYTFNPTQDQLDKMYKCYPKSNEVPIKFLLTTKGEWESWPDTQQDKILQLTGIAKTQHIGVNNSSRRCQVWWGDDNNTPRRAVTWVGDNSNNARRTI